ncbi:MAG: hypothetical protein AAFZ17_07070 [Cyanobacteria bacterium J06650_10]
MLPDNGSGIGNGGNDSGGGGNSNIVPFRSALTQSQLTNVYKKLEEARSAFQEITPDQLAVAKTYDHLNNALTIITDARSEFIRLANRNGTSATVGVLLQDRISNDHQNEQLISRINKVLIDLTSLNIAWGNVGRLEERHAETIQFIRSSFSYIKKKLDELKSALGCS